MATSKKVESKNLECDVLVVGGGAGGISAAIWSARQGAKTILVEETGWLGGMLTAAGVCCFDGNNGAHSTGFFKEIRSKIESYYGGADKVRTGWVTQCAFEPHVGNDIFRSIAAVTPNLTVFFYTRATKVLVKKNKVTGVQVETEGDKEKKQINAKITIDATEYGDVIEMSGADFRLGRDSKKMTGEPDAPDKPDNVIQDITYVAILKDYGKGANKTLTKPEGYNESKFDGATKVHCSDPSWHNHKIHDWNSFITYGKLPNDKYMINWPFHANDFPTFLPPLNSKEREKEFEKAKQHTLQFIYYIQTKLKHPELGLAEDEFPTDDYLPLIPYCRESRRLVGAYLMREQDVIPVGDSGRPPLQKNSIAIGDYFLDHHHAEPPKGQPGIREKFPNNAPFQIPYGVLVPEKLDGLMAAEKNISVTHIVNGCTRLQPVVLLIGQACGVAAALCAKQEIEPRDLNVKEVQRVLLQNRDTLFPYDDVYSNHQYFISIQKLALANVMTGAKGQKFEPNSQVTKEELINILEQTAQIVYEKSERPTRKQIETWVKNVIKDVLISRAELVEVLIKVAGLQPVIYGKKMDYKDIPADSPLYGSIARLYRDGCLIGLKGILFESEKTVTRAELASWIDNVFKPWEKM